MATGATEFVDKTIADGVFSPDIWSKQVLRAKESRLVFANVVNRGFETDARIGKTVKVASISNLAGGTKSENTAITYETAAETAKTITLDQWKYAAVGIEDIVEVQENVNSRSEYQKKIGYALAKLVDDDLADLVAGFSHTQGTLGSPFTDAHVLRAVQYLDDADADEDDRVLIMSPAEKRDKLTLDRWTNSLYRGSPGEQVNRGRIGTEIYGLTPYVTTNLNKAAAGQGDNTVLQREAVALVMQRDPKMHLFYDIDLFTWKVAAEEIYGDVEMRDDHGVWLKGIS